MLRQLQAAHLPLALVTSAHRWKVERVLKQLGLEQVFAAQITAHDIARGKPDPACYVRAAQALGGKHPSRCLVFEDAPIGVRAARSRDGVLWCALDRHSARSFGCGSEHDYSRSDIGRCGFPPSPGN